MKNLFLLVIFLAGISVSFGDVLPVEVKVGTGLAELEGRIAGSRLKEVTMYRDVEIPEGIFPKTYRVDDTCYLSLSVSKTTKKIVSMQLLSYPAGAGNTPKMYVTILGIDYFKIDPKGAFTLTSRP